MKLEDCYKARLLRRIEPDRKRSSKALDMSMERIERASDLHESGYFEECIVAAYSGMLMAAKALLFKDGIVEKNHYCVVMYLNDKYLEILGPEIISWLDTYRIERHQWFYGLEGLSVDELGSSDALDRANRFIQKVSEILVDEEKEE